MDPNVGVKTIKLLEANRLNLQNFELGAPG